MLATTPAGSANGTSTAVAASARCPPDRRDGFDYWKVLECTHRYNESYYHEHNATDLSLWPGYDAFAQTQDALQYLHDQRDNGRPTFLGLSWGPPHGPYLTAPERYRRLYDAETLTLPPNVPADMEADVRPNLAGYYAHCTALDEAFGQLLDGLETLGISDNTIVVFTSDHGDRSVRTASTTSRGRGKNQSVSRCSSAGRRASATRADAST